MSRAIGIGCTPSAPEARRPAVRTGGASGAESLHGWSREHAHDRLAVLIPEVEPARWWQRALQSRRGAVTDRALRRHNGAVVCRLRMRMWAGEGDTSAGLIETFRTIRGLG
ncbi:hypothetical protein ACIRVF_41140 [Kitasatospora sp. NPDC101157]|uniref:hypothetical protein n=1 Tax=Kitasatospora sp. NPDC101157 TaxID=3364098 RepID=UPI0037F7E358